MPERNVRIDGIALVLEDDLIIGLDLADTLAEAGAEARQATTVAEALAVVEAEALRVALLDVNLGSETSRPVAEALAARGVPFLLITGYGDGDVTAAYPEAPVLRKPFAPAELRAHLTDLLS